MIPIIDLRSDTVTKPTDEMYRATDVSVRVKLQRKLVECPAYLIPRGLGVDAKQGVGVEEFETIWRALFCPPGGHVSSHRSASRPVGR